MNTINLYRGNTERKGSQVSYDKVIFLFFERIIVEFRSTKISLSRTGVDFNRAEFESSFNICADGTKLRDFFRYLSGNSLL